MAVNTTGVEFKRFYKDPNFWPDDEGATWHEAEQVLVDGAAFAGDDLLAIPDTAQVSVVAGVVHGPKWAGNEPSFEDYFRAWRTAQATTRFVVECENQVLDKVLAAVADAGGRALR